MVKITGSRSHIEFDMENGYVLKAKGELLVGLKFVVEKASMKKWEPPHDKEPVTEEEINKIIEDVNEVAAKNKMEIIFE